MMESTRWSAQWRPLFTENEQIIYDLHNRVTAFIIFRQFPPALPPFLI
jgi:hypothetical protein